MKGEKIIEKKFNFNVTSLVIHDKELSDKLLKEAIKEKTSNNKPHVKRAVFWLPYKGLLLHKTLKGHVK